ncbi:hypothetical protein EIP86_011006, partial [Pleurotus ostreatoroseus]
MPLTLPEGFYLPRDCVGKCHPGTTEDRCTLPTYMSCNGKRVTFCVFGVIPDVELCNIIGAPLPTVYAEIESFHADDGPAIINIGKKAEREDKYSALMTVPTTLLHELISNIENDGLLICAAKNMLVRKSVLDHWK